MITYDQLRAELSHWVIAERYNRALIQLGPSEASHRVWWDTGTHGEEYAPPLALLHFAERYGLDWPWPNIQIMATIADPQGYDELGYGFVGVDGAQSCWPPLWGYRQDTERFWSFVDQNSAWGNTAMPAIPRPHRFLREAMQDFEPTFVLSSHETADKRSRDFWAGCGLLILEYYPVLPETVRALAGIPSPTSNLVGFLGYLIRRWAWLLLSQKRWKRSARILRNHPGWGIITAICEKYTELGGGVAQHNWMRYQEAFGELIVGPGRIITAGYESSDWLVVPLYACRYFGCPGVTLESFPTGRLGIQGLDARARQHETFAQAVAEVLDAGTA